MRAARVALSAALAVTAATTIAATTAVATNAFADTTVTLPSAAASGLAGAVAVGPDSADHVLHLGFSLRGRDDAGRDAYARALFDKSSPSYHRFLTPAQYAAAYGVDPARAAAAQQWLTAGGLHVDYASSDGTYLFASGTAADVDKLLGVDLQIYRLSIQRFVATTVAPNVPASFGIKAVLGLDGRRVMQTHVTPVSESKEIEDLWSDYEVPSSNTGQGQQLAAIGWGVSDGVESDLRAFESAHHLPAVPFTANHIGAVGTDTSGKGEWDLDSQASTGMAPNVSGFTFYFGPDASTASTLAATQAWVDDPAGSLQASSSFGLCESFATFQILDDESAYDTALQKAAMEGRTMFVSSGDNGAQCKGVSNGLPGAVPGVEYPASSPWVVGVGGTDFTNDAIGDGTRPTEYAWTESGGGISTLEPAQPWQLDLADESTPTCVTDVNSNVTTPFFCRVVPDVAAMSGDLTAGFGTYVDGAEGFYLGTSLSAPLWQGMWARVDATAPLATNGCTQGVGFAAPLLYGIAGDSAKYAAAMHDIIVGDNGPFPAHPGYDAVTGLGSPNVSALATTISGSTNAVVPTGAGCAGSGGSTGGGDTGGGTPPPPPAPDCAAGPQLTDVAGDASIVGEPSNDDLDLRSVLWSWTDSSSTLHAVLTVNKLAAAPPQTATGDGDHFEMGFTYAGTDLLVTATRDLVDANSALAGGSAGPQTETFTLATPGASGSFPTDIATLTGSFDPSTSTVTVNLPAAVIAQAAGVQAPAPGSTLSAFTANSQYDESIGRLTADTATNDCGWTIPVPTSPPAAPALSAASTKAGAVALSWSTSADGHSPITGYRIYRGAAAGTVTLLTTVGAAATSYSDGAVTLGAPYVYRVAAVNAVGTGAQSNEVTVTPISVPGSPQLTATAGKNQATLVWSAPANGGSPITSYSIYRGTAAGSETLVQTITSGTSYVDGGLSGGTTYFYKVLASNSAGDGAASNETSATPKGAKK